MADVFESLLTFLERCELQKTCKMLREELREVNKRIQRDLQEVEVASRLRMT